MQLDLGPAHAGDLYLVLGSVTGTAPGVQVGSFLMPLNADAYTNKTFASANTGPFVDTLGFLDGAGRATARIQLPPLPSLAGIRADHAAVLLTGPSFSATTGSVPLGLLP